MKQLNNRDYDYRLNELQNAIFKCHITTNLLLTHRRYYNNFAPSNNNIRNSYFLHLVERESKILNANTKLKPNLAAFRGPSPVALSLIFRT